MDGQLQALRNLISDPTANSGAAVLLIGIVVVFVLMVVVLLIALAVPGRARREDRPRDEVAELVEGGPRPTRLGGLGCAALAALLTLGFAVAVMVWYGTTSSNTYCSQTCHAMAVPAATWKRSAHSSVSCVRCHEGRPWSTMVTGLSLRTYSLYLQVSDAKPRALAVPDSRCLECHSAVVDRVLTSLNGETFTHREFIDADKRCTSCHGAQGHVVRGADEATPIP